MKYLINENNSCGMRSVPDAARNSLLESLGYSVAVDDLEATAAPAEEVDSNEYVQQDAPALYEWDSSVFAMSDEVFEIEGDLFVLAEELDDDTTAQLDESHADLFINDVTFDSAEHSLGDVYEMDGKTYIKLSEGKKKGDKSADKDKDDDKADYETGERKGDKSNQKSKKGDKGDFETGERKGDKSNQKSKKGDKGDFTTDQRKGDKSKTHPGKLDFMKKKKKLKEDDEDREPTKAELDKIAKEEEAGTAY